MVEALHGIHIASGPVQTGKTTRLFSWSTAALAQSPGSVDGVLAPVIHGHRHIVHIASGESRDLEEHALQVPDQQIGRFTFRADVFAWAHSILLGAAAHLAEGCWLVVDEIGPLELAGRGLEPAVSSILESGLQTRAHIVLVVREHLVDRVLAHFGVSPAEVQPFLHA